MAYAPHRSAIDELNQGMTDGSYKQVNKDRGGSIDPSTAAARRNLHAVWYGINEAPVKELPDALPAHTPTYATPPPVRPEAV